MTIIWLCKCGGKNFLHYFMCGMCGENKPPPPPDPKDKKKESNFKP